MSIKELTTEVARLFGELDDIDNIVRQFHKVNATYIVPVKQYMDYDCNDNDYVELRDSNNVVIKNGWHNVIMHTIEVLDWIESEDIKDHSLVSGQQLTLESLSVIAKLLNDQLKLKIAELTEALKEEIRNEDS